ncbi:MAG: hypothetical protein WCD79_03100 [Chthoniobacteraceae bacterium]
MPKTSSRNLLGTLRRNKLAFFMLLLAFASGTFFFFYRHGGLLKGSSRSSIEGYDDCCYYFWLRSVMVDHDVDFSNEVLSYNSWDQSLRDNVMQRRRTPLGLVVDKYPIGWALSGVPWFMMADLVAGTLNLTGKHVPLDGWGPVYQAAVMFGQAIYTCLGLWFAYGILARFFPARYAVPGILLAWLASPQFIYQTVHLSMSHGVMFFAVTGAWYFCLRLSDQPELRRYWMITGCFCAFTILVRNQGALLLIYPAALWLRLVIKTPRLLGHAALGGGCFLLTISLQLIAWKLLYGSFIVYTYTGEGFHWLHPHPWKILFSSNHGWFNWHPAMAIGSVGFFLWVGRQKSLVAWCFLVSYFAYLYINAAWDCWWFGASFGAREFEASTLFVMIGTAYLIQLAGSRRVLHASLVGIFLLLAVWNLNLTWITERCGGIPWGEPVTNTQKLQISMRYWSGRM